MSSTAARIGVAGLGLISPLGHTLEAFQAKVLAGESAVGPWPLDLPGIDPVAMPLARCDFNDAAVRTASRVPADRGTAMALPAAMAAEISLQLGIRGRSLTYAGACASSAVAIGEVMRALRVGWIEVALVGGH